MDIKPSLLIVDADIGFVHAAAEVARAKGFEITVAGSLQQALSRLGAMHFDLALIDLALPDGSGLDLLEHLDLGGRTQVILVTGHPTVETALKALHLPIVDYVVKPLHPEHFRELLEKAGCLRRLPPPDDGHSWHGLAGRSQHIQGLREEVLRVAGTDASVFIHGESGVGKELIAAAVHAESGRTGNFVALNCGAVPSELLTSQLFGHEKGSFTGANTRHLGLFQQADGGTLFLDEITEMPLHLQVHLLRALETHTIRRIGGTDDIPVDVRIISATNRPPEQARQEGKLREDLYYRLAEFPMRVSPLRERPEDILPIASLFLQRLNERYGTRRSFPADVEDVLGRFSWPGNVRELKNAIQRAYILAEGEVVRPEIPTRRLSGPLAETASTITFAVGTPLEEIERRMLFKTLAFYKDNKAKAAEALGITTKTIYNRLAGYQAKGRGLGPERRADAGGFIERRRQQVAPFHERRASGMHDPAR
jgi:DNA-binding NtrC family response regulator